jgi:PAS domain S-box-containing protein
MPNNSSRILIVEDETLLAKDLSRQLRATGHEVIATVVTGEDAAALCKTIAIDLVLMDIALAGDMDGVETAEYIQSYQDPAIVYITAHDDKGVFERAKRTEPYGFLGKPVSRMELRHTVEMALYRHSMEKKLRESEGRLRLITDALPALIGYVDENRNYAFTNKTHKIWNDRSRRRIQSKHMRDVLGEEVYREIAPYVDRALSGETVEYEASLAFRDGVRRHVSTVYVPDSEEKNRVKGFALLGNDITERKEMEESLRESEERFRRTFDQAPIGAAMVGLDGRYLKVNREMSRILGYSERELTSMGYLDITHSDHAGTDRENIAKLASGDLDHYQTDKRYVRKDGSFIWGRTSIRMVCDTDGKPLYFLPMTEDITDRKRVQEELVQANEEWERTFDAVPDLVMILDYHHRIVRVNSATAKRLGVSKEAMVGKECYQFFHAADKPPSYCPCAKLKADGMEHEEEVYEPTLGGIFHISATPLHDAEGQVKGCVHVARDISEQKRMQANMERTVRDLQRSGEELEALLASSRAVLEYPNFEESARHIYDEAKKMTGASAGYVALLSDDERVNEVLFLDAGSAPCTVDPSLPMPLRGLRDVAYRTGKTVYENDFLTSSWRECLPPGHVELHNVLFAPLVIDGKVQGVMGLANKPGGFNDDDIRLLTAFAEHCSIGLVKNRTALALQDAYDELERTGRERTEELTGINEKLRKEIEDRKHAEMALRESEEKIRLIAETMDDVVWMSTPGIEEMLYVSPAYERVWGRTRESLYQVPQSFMETIHPDDLERLESALGLHAEGKWDYEYRITHPDGTVRWIQDRGHPIRDEQGRIRLVTGVARDITDRKRAEESVRDSLREKELLLREIHHRVKNNLAIIDSLLSLQAGCSGNQACHEMLEVSRARLRSMSLAHEILYQSKNLASLSASDYIESLVDHLVTTVNWIGTAVEMKKEIQEFSVGLDTAIPLGFVVTELVSNALKHAFPERGDGEVRITLKELSEKQFELSVSDNGVGMHTFDRDDPGSLGLDLVYALVDQLRGEVEIEYEMGTTVRIKFSELERK